MHMSATVMRQLYGSSGSILHFFIQLLIWNHWIINRFFAIKFFSRVINENLKKGKEKKKEKMEGRQKKKEREINTRIILHLRIFMYVIKLYIKV